MLRLRDAASWLRRLYAEINSDNVFMGAAALAFYLTLSIFPAIILALTILPYLPVERVDEAIFDFLAQALPQEAYALLEQVIAQVMSKRRGGLLSFSILFTLWATSTGMYAIMQQMNITYGVNESRSFLRARAVALLLSLLFAALVLAAFSLIVLGGALESWLMEQLGFAGAVALFFRVFRWVIIALTLLFGLAIIYRYAPNVVRPFVVLTPGAVAAAGLIVVASLAFSLYTSNFGNYEATYGSIGAVIILMLWLYVVGLVLLVGSEVDVLWGRRQRADQENSDPV